MSHSISLQVITCLRELSDIVSSKRVLAFESEVQFSLWEDEIGRLRVWSANIGAHQRGQASLDYRLRDASHIKEQTIRLLSRLHRLVEDLQTVLEEPALERLSLEPSPEEQENETEIQQIYQGLVDTITCLYQMSILIRRPTSHDRILGTKRIDTSYFEFYDRQHVTGKYPNADKRIVERLGMAISRRRGILKYRERHHEKLGKGLKQALSDQPDTVSTKLSETVATEFCEANLQHIDSLSESGVSHTSYGQSLFEGRERLVIPPPPKESENENLFECPYCFLIITIRNRQAWARHVFSDIVPYICIVPDCETPHRLYDSRREWFGHLQQSHLQGTESANSRECVLCHESMPSPKTLERHLGRHLEELALFALPRTDAEEEEDALDPIDSNGHSNSSAEITSPDERRLNVNDETSPDFLLLKNRGVTYPLHFAPFAIDETLTVGEVRRLTAEKIGTSDPSRIRLLYKGKLLRDDARLCRDEGLKQESEIMCVVREGDSNSEDFTSQSEKSDSVASVGKNKKAITGDSPNLAPPSGNPAAPYPAPNLQNFKSAHEQVEALASYFRSTVVPLCNKFISLPPPDTKMRDHEHKKLAETILTQVILKADEIDSESEIERMERRALIKEVQTMLNKLDEVTLNPGS
jgi:hypothetical protein